MFEVCLWYVSSVSSNPRRLTINPRPMKVTYKDGCMVLQCGRMSLDTVVPVTNIVSEVKRIKSVFTKSRRDLIVHLHDDNGPTVAPKNDSPKGPQQEKTMLENVQKQIIVFRSF